MKSKVLVKLMVVLTASAMILLIGTAKLPAGCGGWGCVFTGYGRSKESVLKVAGGGYGLYGRSDNSVYEANGARVKFNKFNPLLFSLFGLFP
jgi:hypothetical protein